MHIRTVSDLNNYLREFFAEASYRSHLGLPYVHPQRTIDAAPQAAPVPVEQTVFLGVFRHFGTRVVRISEGKVQHG